MVKLPTVVATNFFAVVVVVFEGSVVVISYSRTVSRIVSMGSKVIVYMCFV